jgi:hypothetical protein
MPEQQKIKYYGYIPPCGIYCGSCPNFTREKNRCAGADQACKSRKCKGIYVCCIEKKDLEFCYQCKSYPCARYRKFADTWKKYGQNLLDNQELIKNNGKEDFLNKMNEMNF